MDEMRSLYATVSQIFNSIRVLMEQTEEMGTCFKALYSDEELYKEYIGQMAKNMAANRQVTERHEKIHVNLTSQIDEVEIEFKEYLIHCKTRENARIYFDHYRLKLQALNTQAQKRAERTVTSNTMAMGNVKKE